MAPFDTPIGDLLNPHVISVHVEDDQEKVAQVFSRYGYQAIPVVDGDNRLVGIITVDDVIDVLNEEFTEDLHHLAGIGKEEKVDGSVADSVKSRLPWLAVNLVTALAASFVINLFNGTIEKIVALSAVMTIISGMGGNAGTQTLTLVIRALSLEEIDRENARPILLKELGAGLINGAAIGVLVAGIAMFYDANPPLWPDCRAGHGPEYAVRGGGRIRRSHPAGKAGHRPCPGFRRIRHHRHGLHGIFYLPGAGYSRYAPAGIACPGGQKGVPNSL